MRRVKKDDLVQVMAGKDRGRSGKVLRVFPSEGTCIVEGVGTVKKHQKATQSGGPAGIVEKNMRIDLSNVMPIDAKTKKPTRVKVAADSSGNRVRQSVASNEIDTAAKA